MAGIPGGRLAATWRYLLCQRLRQRYRHDGRLRAILNQLYQKRCGLQVYTNGYYPKGVAAATNIGRFMGHPPLAISHLTHLQGKQVRLCLHERVNDACYSD